MSDQNEARSRLILFAQKPNDGEFVRHSQAGAHEQKTSQARRYNEPAKKSISKNDATFGLMLAVVGVLMFCGLYFVVSSGWTIAEHFVPEEKLYLVKATICVLFASSLFINIITWIRKGDKKEKR